LGADSGDDVVARLLAAVDLALKGDWQGAHLVAQEHEGHELANWLHAVAHRMEGDVGNARYWYARCGRQLREDLPVKAELLEIRAALERARRAPKP
jgi:hypothetical protein